jgi:hypothetical protein
VKGVGRLQRSIISNEILVLHKTVYSIGLAFIWFLNCRNLGFTSCNTLQIIFSERSVGHI